MVNGVMNNNNMSPTMAPCTRILAMNMIGDLMRKVGVSKDLHLLWYFVIEKCSEISRKIFRVVKISDS